MTSRIVVSSALVASLCFAEAALAQVQTPATEATPARPLEAGPITTEERQVIDRTVLSDARVRAIVGEGAPRVITGVEEVDKAEADAFLAGKTTTPPTRRLSVKIGRAHV